MSDAFGPGDDPRRARPPADTLEAADLDARPAVARRGDRLPLWLGGVGIAALAVILFLWLSAGRKRAAEGELFDPAARPSAAGGVLAAPLPLPAAPATPATGPLTNVPAPQFTTNNSVPMRPAAPPAPAMAGGQSVFAPGAMGNLTGPASAEQRRRAPALVVDLGGADAPVPAAPFRPSSAPGAAATAAADAAAKSVSDEERFADRIGTQEVERARATQLRNLGLLVPQGTTIAATLETALDSDLPGYARAIVARDVKGFDGRSVLIPRGSRVIGQYKAATALGASRVFVIWTRLIRPDGASIQLGSPAADDLGRAGLSGKVDRHFFERFGGAILLSVLNAGVAAVSNLQTNAQVYIGSSSDASNVAAAALSKDGARPPTIRTPQGAAVNIFTARDLDFSTVGPAK